MKNKNILNKISVCAAKAAEIIHWIGAGSMLVLFVCSFAAKEQLMSMVSAAVASGGAELSCYAFEISVTDAVGGINIPAFTMFSIGAAIILSLLAMTFRNVYLILKTANGETWFAEGATPFQKNIVRMFREIGIFLISAPVVGFIVSIISRAVIGVEAAEISVRFEGIIIGLLMLCLSDFFSRGAELQKDVDGLL